MTKEMLSGGARRPIRRWVVSGIFSSTCLVAWAADYVPAHNPGAREALRDVSFQPGITHVGGNYRFTDRHYLLEGATRAERLGTQALFVYLTSNFRAEYPDPGTGLWPRQDPVSMVNLIQTRPYQMLLSMPFKTFVLTGFSFVDADNDFESLAPGWEQRVENECFELAKYLLKTYSGQGKTFILKNHETDWHSTTRTNPDGSFPEINEQEADVIRKWFAARQRGVNRARAWARTERPPIQGVAVYHAAEVNLVVEAGEGRQRVLNLVIGRMRRPDPEPDMVSYSAHDSVTTVPPEEAFDSVTKALQSIDQFAPDPLGLKRKRIFISEFGLYENDPEAGGGGDPVQRTQEVLRAAEGFGLPYAFHWEIFDNECRDPLDPSGERWVGDIGPEGVAIGLGERRRPSNRHCRGLWLIRPDGSAGGALRPLLDRWNPSCPLHGVGDLNCDGTIDQRDADLLADMISGRVPSQLDADLNGDGRVDIRDVTVITTNRTNR
ncbi:MAG: hypothetical protein HYZ73_01745 [Elusimicrobia bacterium]|nr:hypothetical protein [Elusimicrobiota bacterium]